MAQSFARVCARARICIKYSTKLWFLGSWGNYSVQGRLNQGEQYTYVTTFMSLITTVCVDFFLSFYTRFARVYTLGPSGYSFPPSLFSLDPRKLVQCKFNAEYSLFFLLKVVQRGIKFIARSRRNNKIESHDTNFHWTITSYGFIWCSIIQQPFLFHCDSIRSVYTGRIECIRQSNQKYQHELGAISLSLFS